MGILILILIFAVFLGILGIGLWLGLAKFVNDNSDKLGTSVWIILIHFIIVSCITFALHYFIIGLNVCFGFLCGLEAFFFFMAVTGVITLGWPVVLLIYYRKKKENYKKN